jgi:hypothetical protein
MRYKVPKDWMGATCVILAGGPSLPTDIGQRLSSKTRVIAINDSWRLFPQADALYFGDATWWHNQQAMNPRTLDGRLSFHDMIYKGFWVTIANFSEHPQVHCLWSTTAQGLEKNPVALATGANSGYAAINLAYLYGARRIVLLGYDMKCAGARTHWHNGPRERAGVFQVALNSFLYHFESLVEPLKKEGVEVINATPDSALTCWPYLPLEEALEEVSWKAE